MKVCLPSAYLFCQECNYQIVLYLMLDLSCSLTLKLSDFSCQPWGKSAGNILSHVNLPTTYLSLFKGLLQPSF